jgi:MFS family permease
VLGAQRIAVETRMDDADEARPSKRRQHGLDWLSFFIVDVQTGFGPFVAVYLASQNWSQGEIGLLLTVSTLSSIASQAPGGALVDAAPSKRLLIAGALGFIALGALIFAFFPNPIMAFAAAVLYGSTGGVIRPALAAIGLGLVGHEALSGRLGRNERYNAFGNAATAGLMGVLAHLTSERTTFLVAAALCPPAAYALSGIRGNEIDYARARSARDREKPREAVRLREIVKNRALVVFIGTLVLFQLADASVMPLVGGRLGNQDRAESELVTAALVAVHQVVTALIAAWVASRADRWGRKPLLLAGFCILPVRAALFAVASDPMVSRAGSGLWGPHRGNNRHHDPAGHRRCHARHRAV